MKVEQRQQQLTEYDNKLHFCLYNISESPKDLLNRNAKNAVETKLRLMLLIIY